jgi:electron transfer flavoprotein alpha subunit
MGERDSMKMDQVLLLVNTEADGGLHKSALEALTAAKTLAEGLGATLSIGLVGADVAAAANSVAGAGAAKIYGLVGAAFAQARYATDAAAATALTKAAGATLVLMPATSRWSRVAAGVAHRLGGAADTNVTSLAVEKGQLTVTRWFYRQRIEGQLRRATRPWVLTIAPGNFAPWSGMAGAATVEPVTVAPTDALNRTQVTGVAALPAEQQTIRPDAALLFVAGAGWTKKQADGQPHPDVAERLILDFLKKTGASLGSSKSLVDLSGEGQAVLQFMTHMNQVGQTGATPRHPKGLSTCCHGEEPHVVGWRFINERRAINIDPGCGWAQGKADVLYVADAFAVMEKLNALL